MNCLTTRYNLFHLSSRFRSAIHEINRALPNPKPEEITPTPILYAQLQECLTMLAIAESIDRTGMHPQIVAISDAYRDELRIRIEWLRLEISKRLEAL